MSLQKALAHNVEWLARQYNIEIVHRGRGAAMRRSRRITIPPVRGRMSYLVALHEIGHIVGRNPPLRLSQEVAAWEWALEHSIVEPTVANYRSIHRSLENYSRRQQRWASMKRPVEFDAFLAAIAARAGKEHHA
jgi:hypothetical protein